MAEKDTEAIVGEITESTSSDAYITRQLNELSDQYHGITGNIIDISSKDTFKAESVIPSTIEQNTSATLSKQVQIQPLSHIHSKTALRIRDQRAGRLHAEKKAA